MAAILDWGRPFPSSKVDWMWELPNGGGLTHKSMKEFHEDDAGAANTANTSNAQDIEQRAQRILTGMGYHHDILEIDDRHIPTNKSDMWHSWNLGATEPTGNFVHVEPWMDRFKMLPDKRIGGLPRPPIEVARIVSKGGVFRNGQWRL